MLRPLYKILENPAAYDLVQKLLGGDRVLSSIRKAVSGQLENMRYNNVLDVGCGTGLFSDCFKGKYTGVDINKEYIKDAAAKRKGVFKVADATALPFKSGAFDLVFTLGVLHHLDEELRMKMLLEMQRICKKGGHMLIVDGLVPSNSLNLIGYALARLDRGRYKLRLGKFKDMLANAYSGAGTTYEIVKVFPYELVVAVVQR